MDDVLFWIIIPIALFVTTLLGLFYTTCIIMALFKRDKLFGLEKAKIKKRSLFWFSKEQIIISLILTMLATVSLILISLANKRIVKETIVIDEDANVENKIEQAKALIERKSIPVDRVNEEKLKEIIMSLSQLHEIDIDTVERKDTFFEVSGIAKDMGNFFDFVNGYRDCKVKTKVAMTRKTEVNKVQFIIRCYIIASPAPK